MKIEIKTNRLEFSLLYFYLLTHYRKYQLEYAGWTVLFACILFFPNIRRHYISAEYLFLNSVIALLLPLATEVLGRLIDSKNRNYILGIYPASINVKLQKDQTILHLHWEQVKSITVAHRYIFIFFKSPLALTIPSRVFTNKATRDDFIDLVNQYRKIARQKG